VLFLVHLESRSISLTRHSISLAGSLFLNAIPRDFELHCLAQTEDLDFLDLSKNILSLLCFFCLIQFVLAPFFWICPLIDVGFHRLVGSILYSCPLFVLEVLRS
jgi:hypothetical protein